MAKEDIFDKEWVDERDKNSLEVLLEQMNLPPAAVKFVRDHKRAVQVGIGVVIIAIVTWSLYTSYRDNRIEKSSAALSAAGEVSGPEMLDKLAQVESEFSGTSAALWAQIVSAQELVEEEKFEAANEKFKAVRESIGKSAILQPLVGVGIAETAELLANYEESISEYQILTGVEGYEDIGFMGLGRVHELQGNSDAALKVYEGYLADLDPTEIMQKRIVEEKIIAIKARQ